MTSRKSTKQIETEESKRRKKDRQGSSKNRSLNNKKKIVRCSSYQNCFISSKVSISNITTEQWSNVSKSRPCAILDISFRVRKIKITLEKQEQIKKERTIRTMEVTNLKEKN
jgi:hypothetical protein